MPFEIQPGVRYRMPLAFGPATGPRQHPDGRPWTLEETGTMNGQWLTVEYRTDAAKLAALLPPGFSLRGDPVVSVACGWFKDLYWLAGRGYGILSIEFPVTYQGKTERIDGVFCPVLWEGQPEAITTGREELGFPKLYGDFEEIDWDEAKGTARCRASWLGFNFFDIALTGLTEEAEPERKLPQARRGVPLYFKYMPRTGPGGLAGADVTYVTTALPAPGAPAPSPLEFGAFRKWNAQGSVRWNRATFAQLPLSFQIVNAIADLPILDYVDAGMLLFSRPGIAASVGGMRVVEPASAPDGG